MRVSLVLLVFSLLVGCQQVDGGPVAVSITSPAVGQPVSGTTQIQVTASSGTGITKVTVYARAKGSAAQGVAVGSATTEPYVIAWYTPAAPNSADLELYADAESSAGTHATSDPVWVKTNNVGAPSLKSVAAYTLSVQAAPSTLAFQDGSAALLDRLLPQRLLTTRSTQTVKPTSRSSYVTGQASGDAQFVLQWAWQPVSGAAGYRLWQAQDDLIGPYTNVYNQLATAGTQLFSRTLPTAQPGQTYHGLVTAMVAGSESGQSNADSATFLNVQHLDAPAAGATVADGRPNLSWKSTPGATGYLWFVSTKPQATATPADWVCTNSPDSTDLLLATYPSRCATLKSGTYYWWVAGVSFNTLGQPDAYALSADRTLFVP